MPDKAGRYRRNTGKIIELIPELISHSETRATLVSHNSYT